jgi:Na+/alanine symporter
MFAPASIASENPERCLSHTRTIHQCATKKVREALEELMKTHFKDSFIDGLVEQAIQQAIQQGIQQGIVQGEERVGIGPPRRPDISVSQCQ